MSPGFIMAIQWQLCIEQRRKLLAYFFLAHDTHKSTFRIKGSKKKKKDGGMYNYG